MEVEIDSIQLEIFRNLFTSVAEEMGAVLKRTSYSPNIKERRDYSCAVFDRSGEVVAMGDHMPVHLGSMPMSVRAAIDSAKLDPGDLVILNDPFAGGTHLPDITMVLPVYVDGRSDQPEFFLSSRAHHSDVGGMAPGSMPLSREIFQEGIRIPPVKLYRQGWLNRELLRFLLCNVRTPLEREGDLSAQVASLRTGEARLQELVLKYGDSKIQVAVAALHDYAERIVRSVITEIPDGRYLAEDHLDDDGTMPASSPKGGVRIRTAVEVTGDQIRFDFTGSHPQVAGCLNAVEAIAISAVNYVLRCLAPPDTPNSAGLMRPVEVEVPPGTVVSARYPAATAAGNVETSQRIVDVIFRALADALPSIVPAASSGTMNNLAIGGWNPRTSLPFSYYETVGGGMGASPVSDGNNGIHTHMTNSLNTPIEALEPYFPFRIREYRLRARSGGRGKFRGGDGIVRSYQVLTDCEVSLLSERRKFAPYGLGGGTSGKKGVNWALIKGRRRRLSGKIALTLSEGDVLTIETPGGGGWGTKGA